MLKSRSRLSASLLALFILAGSAVAMAAFMIPSAEDLLLQSFQTTQAISDGHAVVTAVLNTPDQDMTATVELWGKLAMGPNGEPGLRAEVLDSDKPELMGTTAVTDGANFWLYHPNENKVLVGTAADLEAMLAEQAAKMDGRHNGDHDFDHEEFDMPETPEEALELVLQYVTVERTGRVDINGQSAYQIRVVPIPEQMPDEVRLAGGFVNIWVRTADSAPLGAEYAEGTPGYGQVQATTLELNQGIDDAVFTFEIPAGAEVINVADLELPEHDEAAAEIDFAPLAPSSVPAAATLSDTLQLRGAQVQRYTLPNGSFSIAEGPAAAAAGLTGLLDGATETAVTVRGINGTLFTDADGTRALVTWEENGRTVWVGGDLTPEEALAIAESLQ